MFAVIEAAKDIHDPDAIRIRNRDPLKDTIVQCALMVHADPPMSLDESRKHYDDPKKDAEAQISYAMHVGRELDQTVKELVNEYAGCQGKSVHDAGEQVREAIIKMEDRPGKIREKGQCNPEVMTVHAMCRLLPLTVTRPPMREMQAAVMKEALEAVPRNLARLMESEAAQKRKEFLNERFGARGTVLAACRHVIISPSGVHFYGDAEEETDRIAGMLVCGHSREEVAERANEIIHKKPSDFEREFFSPLL